MNRRFLPAALVVAAALAILFLQMRPGPASLPPDLAQPAPADRPVEGKSVREVTTQIHDGHVSDGARVTRVRQGERLRLTFTSNRPAEIHLHGYDLTLMLDADTPGHIEFTATHSGRFEYELHGSGSHGHAALGVVEVEPQ